jgi:hypothetical protein
MTDLSPAAQAIKNAVLALDPDRRTFKWVWSLCRPIAAAAIRAAADQADPKTNIKDISYTHQNYVDGWKDALDVILAIATELKTNA